MLKINISDGKSLPRSQIAAFPNGGIDPSILVEIQ
jgi:hypothetical protein